MDDISAGMYNKPPFEHGKKSGDIERDSYVIKLPFRLHRPTCTVSSVDGWKPNGSSKFTHNAVGASVNLAVNYVVAV